MGTATAPGPNKPGQDTANQDKIDPKALKAALVLIVDAMAVIFDTTIAFWWSTAFSALAVLLSFWLPGAVRTQTPAYSPHDDHATTAPGRVDPAATPVSEAASPVT